MIAARHDAPTLVLLPGWGFSSAVFSPLIEHLRDRSIMTLDLPGYGEERGTPAPRDVILSQLPPVCDLMGWSLGGQVAMEIAATNPGRVRRLVLVATTPCFVRRRGWNAGTPRAMFDEFNWRLAQDPIATLKNFLSRVARGDANERSVLRKLRVAASRAAAPDVLALRAGLDLLRDMDLRKQVPAIRVPTLVIHGTRDRVVPPAAGRWITRHIAGAKFAALPDAAHAPFLSDTATFIAAMTRFLAAA